MQKGRFDHANSCLPNAEQTRQKRKNSSMPKILIPTPLRQFADKQDTVELTGATVGEVLGALTAQYPDLRSILQRRRQAAQLRKRLSQRRRHPLPEKRSDAGERRRHAFDCAQHCGRQPGVAEPVEPSPLSQGRDPALQPAPDHARSRYGGPAQAEEAKVLLVGAGGLGAPLALYLAAAGVGRIGIVDFDVVDFTNLQRQVIHGTSDVGRKKLDSAADTMRGINPVRAASISTKSR